MFARGSAEMTVIRVMDVLSTRWAVVVTSSSGSSGLGDSNDLNHLNSNDSDGHIIHQCTSSECPALFAGKPITTNKHLSSVPPYRRGGYRNLFIMKISPKNCAFHR